MVPMWGDVKKNCELKVKFLKVLFSRGGGGRWLLFKRKNGGSPSLTKSE